MGSRLSSSRRIYVAPMTPGASMTVATTTPPSPRAASSTAVRTAGSIRTEIVPPQERPTSQAVSSATP